MDCKAVTDSLDFAEGVIALDGTIAEWNAVAVPVNLMLGETLCAAVPAAFEGQGHLHAQPPDRLWARLRDDVNCGLRRGAWYRVVQLTPGDAVVEVQRKRVNVPRAVLTIVS